MMIDESLYKSVVLIGAAYELLKDREDIHHSVKEAVLESVSVLANMYVLQTADIDIIDTTEIDKEIDEYVNSIKSAEDLKLPSEVIDKIQSEWDKIQSYNNRFSNPDANLTAQSKAEVEDMLAELSEELGDI